jgi:hypothetical protein
MDWIGLVQDRDKWSALVNVAMNLAPGHMNRLGVWSCVRLQKLIVAQIGKNFPTYPEQRNAVQIFTYTQTYILSILRGKQMTNH